MRIHQFHWSFYSCRYLQETNIIGKSSLFRKHVLSNQLNSAFNIWNLRRDLDNRNHWLQTGMVTPSGLALDPVLDLRGNTLFPLLNPRRPILRVPVVLSPSTVEAKDPALAGDHRTCVGRALPCYKSVGEGNSSQQTQELLCCFGASIDFLKFLQKDLGFDSQIYLMPDGQYGKFDPSRDKWSGVVNELISGKADLGLDLSVNMQRLKVIDMPYPNVPTALNILVKKDYSHGRQGTCKTALFHLK